MSVVRFTRGGGVAKGLGPAAGTRQGPKPRLQAHKFPPKVAVVDEENEILFNVLRDLATAGLYLFLKAALVDFSTGEVITSYAALMGKDDHPRPQRGPKRPGASYEQVRRMLRELEAEGLVARDTERNAALGELRLYLPLVAKAYEEHVRKKTLARTQSQQVLPQGRRGPSPLGKRPPAS